METITDLYSCSRLIHNCERDDRQKLKLLTHSDVKSHCYQVSRRSGLDHLLIGARLHEDVSVGEVVERVAAHGAGKGKVARESNSRVAKDDE